MTLPLVGSSRRKMSRPSVDFPDPDSPTRPIVSPCSIPRLTPSTALTVSRRRASRPWLPAGNSLMSSCACTNGRVAAVSDSAGLELLDTDTGGIMVGAFGLQGRIDARAILDRDWAARIETAPGRRIRRIGNRAGNRLQPPVPQPARPRNRLQQRARVGVERIGEQLAGRRLF